MKISQGTPTSEVNNLLKSVKGGEQVEFEGEFNGQIIFQGSGTQDNPILFTGGIFNTRAPLPDADRKSSWSDMGGNVWRYALPGNSQNTNYRFWLDGVEHARSETGAVTEIKKTSYNVDREFYLYLYSKGNPVCGYDTIEFSGDLQSAITLANLNHVHLKGMDLRGGAGASLDLEFAGHVLIDNCAIGLDATKMGLRAFGKCPNITITGSSIDSGDRLQDDFLTDKGIQDGIYMRGGCSGWRISRSNLKNWGHSCIEVSNVANGDTDLNDNWIFLNTMSAPDVDYCRGIGFDSLLGRPAKDNKVFKNLIENTSVQNQLNCPELEFMANVIRNTRNSKTAEQGVGRGLVIAGYSGTEARAMKIKSNVIVNCASEGLRISHAKGYGPVEYNEISGNIFIDNGKETPYDFEGAQVIIVPQDAIGANLFEGNYFKGDHSRMIYDSRHGGFIGLQEFDKLEGRNNINADSLSLDLDKYIADNLWKD